MPSPPSLSLPSAAAISAIESGLRHSLISICFDQRTTLLTFFLSGEKEETFRSKLVLEENDARCALQLDQVENFERNERFEILFQEEVEWESLTARLGTESFSLVTRRVVEQLEQTQFGQLAVQITRDLEYYHRCDIMADGLRPGFIREQQKMIKEAWEVMFNTHVDESLEREDLIRTHFFNDAPMLTSFQFQRDEMETREEILRTHELETPFTRYVDATKIVRDEFARFWTERVVQFHEYAAIDEQEIYQDVLLQEEFVSRKHILIPDVVSGIETVWREANVDRPERIERNEFEVAEIFEEEAVWRTAFPIHNENESRERLRILAQHSEYAWGTLYPTWSSEREVMFEGFAKLMRCAVISQRFAMDFIATGARKEVSIAWSQEVFKTATSALIEREDIARFEAEDPYFDFAEMFSIEAYELHSRHRKIFTIQSDLTFKLFQKAVVSEEETARQYLQEVEWENGIIFMYSSFHRLWLETVTMGVTRNGLIREWEKETFVMFEVWIRMGIASRSAFALDSELLGMVRDFMPDFDDVAAPDVEEEEQSETQNISNNNNNKETSTTITTISGRKIKKNQGSDVNALPSVFYIGEDPFGNHNENNNEYDEGSPSAARKRRQQQQQQQEEQSKNSAAAPLPPRLSAFDTNNDDRDEQRDGTAGIAIRYRSANTTRTLNAQSEDEQIYNNSEQQSHSVNRPFSGAFNRGNNNSNTNNKPKTKMCLDAVFSSPKLSAQTASVWISPQTFDVVSIRATLRVFSRMRNHAFALLTQFFQIVLRQQIQAKYDEWLSNYGDMGYWAHAIEVGLLEQLHQLDDDLVESTSRTEARALRRGSPSAIGCHSADENLSKFVHERDIRLEDARNKNRPSRTVIDALRESLRNAPRSSQRKQKAIAGWDVDPELMCPKPKASFVEWTPSRMTPDEFAHYEHNVVLRSAGVEKQNPEASRTSRGVLPTSRNGDPGWSIYQRNSQSSMSKSYNNNNNNNQNQIQHTRPQSARVVPGGSSLLIADNSANPTRREDSPGYRTESTVKFKPGDDRKMSNSSYNPNLQSPNSSMKNTNSNNNNFPVGSSSRPMSAQTIPRLAQDNEEEIGLSGTIPHQSNGKRHHERRNGQKIAPRHNDYSTNPQVKDRRRLQFGDIYDADNHDYDDTNNNIDNNEERNGATFVGSPAAATRSARMRNQQSENEDDIVRAYYCKVMKRTEHHQKYVVESTTTFLKSDMKQIPLICRPTPPPTPGPGFGSPLNKNSNHDHNNNTDMSLSIKSPMKNGRPVTASSSSMLNNSGSFNNNNSVVSRSSSSHIRTRY